MDAENNNPFAPEPSDNPNPTGSQTGSPIFDSTSTGLFGASQSSSPLFSTPAFVASSTPAFGASTPPTSGSASPLFGGSFGLNPAFGGFGSTTPTPSSRFLSRFQQSQPDSGSNLSDSSSTLAFGSSSTPRFGSTSNPAFGSSTPAFGANFVNARTGFRNFHFGPGASSTSTFGSSSTPAFGSSSPAFGTSSVPAFGASSTPSFSFGSSPNFGQAQTTSMVGTGSSQFGSTSSPFGAHSSPFGFQTTTPTFGSRGFVRLYFWIRRVGNRVAVLPVYIITPQTGVADGQTGGILRSTFGSSGGFGRSSFGVQRVGSRVAAYTVTPETGVDDGLSGGILRSISAMPAYRDKSHEELRHEDYQHGDKGGLNPAGQSTSLIGFGTPSAPANPSASSSTFNSSSTSGFGTTSGITSNPFGAPSAATSSPFPAPSSTPFGSLRSSAPAQGSTSSFATLMHLLNSSSIGQTGQAFAQTGLPFGQPRLFSATQSLPTPFPAAPSTRGITAFRFGNFNQTQTGRVYMLITIRLHNSLITIWLHS